MYVDFTAQISTLSFFVEKNYSWEQHKICNFRGNFWLVESFVEFFFLLSTPHQQMADNIPHLLDLTYNILNCSQTVLVEGSI